MNAAALRSTSDAKNHTDAIRPVDDAVSDIQYKLCREAEKITAIAELVIPSLKTVTITPSDDATNGLRFILEDIAESIGVLTMSFSDTLRKIK